MPDTITKIDPKGLAVHDDTPMSIRDLTRERMGQLLPLTESQKKRLCKFLEEELDAWEADTEELHARLADDADLCDGIIFETDFPWENCSNVHIPITETYMDVYWSVQKRSILGADLIWNAETDSDELRDLTDQIDEMLNWKARNEWNVEHEMRNVFYSTNRDGLGILEHTWEEETEPCRDVVLVTTVDEFFTEFPYPEEVGLTPDQYLEVAQYIDEKASEEFPVEIPISFDKTTYSGVKAEVVDLVNFVIIPAFAPAIKHSLCRGYGKRFKLRAQTLRQKSKDKVYYADAVTKLIKEGPSTDVTEYERLRDEADGLNRSNVNDGYTLFQLCVKGRLDGDEGEEGKHLVVYSKEHKQLLACMDFPYRVDNMALFRIDERPNRLRGKSVPDKTRDINDEIDTHHNMRQNGRAVSLVPTFKAKKSLKQDSDFDPESEHNRFAPGKIFWLEDFSAFDQFRVQPTDMGESMQEEKSDMNLLDLYLGAPVAVMSGSTAPGDPTAPGNKQAMMIAQGNLRMDSVLESLRWGVEDSGDICLALTYQFGPPMIEYQAMVENGGQMKRVTKTIHKRFLRRNIRTKMSAVTVINNPDAEMQKKLNLYTALAQEPMMAEFVPGRIELLRDALKAGHEMGRDRYLPSLDQVKAYMVNIQKQAMVQMAQEAALKKQQEQQAMVKQRLADAQTKEKIRAAAQAKAAENLGVPS